MHQEHNELSEKEERNCINWQYCKRNKKMSFFTVLRLKCSAKIKQSLAQNYFITLSVLLSFMFKQGICPRLELLLH